MHTELDQDEVLLRAIKAVLPSLKDLLEKTCGHWTYEDGIYRFYHRSFKVFYLQEATKSIVEALQAIQPDVELNPCFLAIVKEGTEGSFGKDTNKNWLQETRPVVEAFLHAKYFLEMVVKYGEELEAAAALLPSGWAGVLYLYNQR